MRVARPIAGRDRPCRSVGLLGAVAALLIGCADEPAGTVAAGGMAGHAPDGGQGGEGPRCAPGEQPVGETDCVAAGAEAGVPPEHCAEGFVPSAEPGSCEPVLPAEPCGAGQLALPGDESCHAVGPCGDGPWGDIELEAGTMFVDASYAGADSDGTEARPWTTVHEAVTAQAPGGLVVIAQGQYVEDVRIATPGLRLWGRCASLVRVSGVGIEPAAIGVFGAADVEIGRLSVDGPRMGLWLRDAPGALVRDVQVEQTGNVGLAVRGMLTTATIDGLLVDSATAVGLLVGGASAQATRIVVRDTRPVEAGGQGYGIVVQPDPEEGSRGELVLDRAVVERNRVAGIGVLASDAHVEQSLIRGTLVDEQSGMSGNGIEALADSETGERATLLLDGSVIEQSGGSALFVIGSDADVDRSVLRDSGWQAPAPQRDWGIAWLEDDVTHEPARGSLRRSTVARSTDAGILASGASVEIEATMVLDTLLGANGWGRGMEITGSRSGHGRTSAVIRSSLVRGSRGVGIFIAGAEVDIEGTRVAATAAHATEGFGYGIECQDHPDTLERCRAAVRFSTVEDSIDCGVLVSSSDATIESTAVRRTAISSEDATGYGIQVQTSGHQPDDELGLGQLLVADCLVEDNGQAAIAVFGSEAEVLRTVMLRSAGSPAGWWGDGLVLSPLRGIPATAIAVGSRITGMHRAGVASFGSILTLERCNMDCNPLAINAESWLGMDPVFTDGGGNRCGCGEAEETCRVLSSGLTPPEAVE